MKLRKWSYLAHRWLGLIISLQLLAWSLGGFMFSILELSHVRGEDNIPEARPPALDPTAVLLSPAEAISRLGANAPVVMIDLHMRDGEPTYFLRDAEARALATVHASTGAVTTQLSPEQASTLARAGFTPDSSVKSVELLEGDLPGEARGRELPLYRVTLDHPTHPRLYLDAVSGDIVARRNDSWRLFDFFWMLHIMDYDERDDFNHPLLTVASALAVLTSASGLALWGWRAGVRLRRRLKARA